MGRPARRMTAREVDRAASRLEHLRDQRRARLLMSAPAAALAGGAFVVSNALAFSLLCGTACLLVLALFDTVRRRACRRREGMTPRALASAAVAIAALTLPAAARADGPPVGFMTDGGVTAGSIRYAALPAGHGTLIEKLALNGGRPLRFRYFKH